MNPERRPDNDGPESPEAATETPPAETRASGTGGTEDPAALRAARRAQRRAQRRGKARRVLDTSVPSPCIQVCQVDPKNDCCIGCGRHVDEIRDWPILSAEEKTAILEKLPERFRKK